MKRFLTFMLLLVLAGGMAFAQTDKSAKEKRVTCRLRCQWTRR